VFENASTEIVVVDSFICFFRYGTVGSTLFIVFPYTVDSKLERDAVHDKISPLYFELY
jgi:hypothetical protein